jgi:pimeloyl-ACP methyl ester carboxylesterase
MATYVLCHGAWSGGWRYKQVEQILRAAGHDVYRPTYTGLGERAHLANPDIDLDTHVQDVLGVITFEEIDEFILVGHSYGGMVITCVADQLWQRIPKIVYLDAFLPENGKSLTDYAGDEGKGMLEAVEKNGEGWKVHRPEGTIPASLTKEERERLAAFTHPQPLKTITQKVDIEGNHLKIPEKVYVLCTENKGSPFWQFAELTRAQADWTVIDLPTHHQLLQSMPQETADILMGKAVAAAAAE